MHAKQVFKKRNNLADIPTQQYTAYHAHKRTEESRESTLYQENLHDAARGQTQRAQNRNIGLFFRYRHYQRRDEVKRSNCDNQRQNDEHHAFFQLNGFKIAAVVKRPVTHPYFIFFSIGNQIGNERRRILRIGQPQTQPTDIFSQSIQDLRILDMRHGQCVIDFINTGFYYTDHIKLLQSRHYAGRSDITLRRNHSNFAAKLRTQCLSQPLA